MAIPILLVISLLLFLGVTWFCHSQGLFMDRQVGWIFAIALYLIFWFGGTAFATFIAFVMHWARG